MCHKFILNYNFVLLFIFIIIYLTKTNTAIDVSVLSQRKCENGQLCYLKIHKYDINMPEKIILNKMNYYSEMSVPARSQIEFNILNLNGNAWNYGYAIFQLHSFEYDVTLSKTLNLEQSLHQNGTNLGFIIYKDTKLYAFNFNYHTSIEIAIIIVVYDRTSPMPGGCNAELPVLGVKPKNEFLEVDTLPGSLSVSMDPSHSQCGEYNLTYKPYFKYLPKQDLSSRTYFNGIKSMVEYTLSTQNGLLAVRVPSSDSVYKRFYIAVPGTGIVFNTILVDARGKQAAYIPAVSYSCIPHFWENSCNFIANSGGLTCLGVILCVVGAIKTVVFCRIAILELFINSVFIGAYLTYHAIAHFDINPSVRKDLIIVFGILFSVAVVVIALKTGLLIVLDIVQKLIFGLVVATLTLFFLRYILLYRVFDKDALYWSTFSVITLLSLLTIIPVCDIITFIINIISNAIFIVIGAQILTKSYSLIIIVDHFHRISNENYKYANGIPAFGSDDLYIVILFVTFVVLGIVFQRKKCVRCNNQPAEGPFVVMDERQPLITRWTNGSDDVFEAPAENSRFFRRVIFRRLRPNQFR